MYRLICSDLDETLLTSSRHVSKKNQQLIQQAEALGVYFVPTTGRGFHSIHQTLVELAAIDQNDHYMIGFNGGVIVKNLNTEIIESHPMSFELMETLYQFSKNYQVAVHLYTFENSYIYNVNSLEAEYLKNIPHEIKADDDYLFLKEEVVYKVLFQNLDRDYLEKIEAALPTELKEQLEISYSSNRYMEFNPSGVTKGRALASLAKKLGIDIAETIAIGDNINDLTMIEDAQLGVAVANAVPKVKQAAQHITTANHEEDAVAEVIETFILNPQN